MSQKYHSPKEYQDAAKSASTPVSELAYLAKSEYNFVRLAVANNPNVTEEILDSLIPSNFDSWNEQEISAALTGNLTASSQTLKKLAQGLEPFLNSGRNNDMAFIAGVNLFNHPNASIESLKDVLMFDKVSVLFRRKIARETKRKDVLDLLLKDPSEAVRKRASKNIELNFEN
ncbi:MAG TPA: hypothetical protein VNB22_17125 [Pyrinomonadaceae bacterium]|nr:hypothetical protein [Pyrinomonadaceae bacterium]